MEGGSKEEFFYGEKQKGELIRTLYKVPLKETSISFSKAKYSFQIHTRDSDKAKITTYHHPIIHHSFLIQQFLIEHILCARHHSVRGNKAAK